MNFFQRVWGNEQGYAAMPHRIEGQWTENTFAWPTAPVPCVVAGDQYFCPSLFSKPKREASFVKPTRWLWADLDTASADKYPPTLLWESSPGRCQALWELTAVVSPQMAENLSRRLAHALGADVSGRQNRVLRVPGTRNWKYKDKPAVRLLINDGPTYDLRVFAALPEPVTHVAQPPETASAKSAAQIRKEWASKLPGKVQQYLAYTDVPRGADRSTTLWELACRLAEIGMPTNEIAVLLGASVWNKYQSRADNWQRLLELGSKAVAQTPAREPDEAAAGPQFVTMADMMRTPSASDTWLIEKVWSAESHGILAGEPKTFKSLLTLEMAVSVATGKPFLGRFEVPNPGPVVVVQEENPLYYMQDRLVKVLTARGPLPREPIKMGNRQYAVGTAPELDITFLNRQGFLLNKPAYRELLEKHIEATKPTLLILDPLYDMIENLDENESVEVRPVLRWLKQVSARYRLSVVLVHHWRKASSGGGRPGQRISGAHVFHAWLDSALYAEQGKKPGDLILHRELRSSAPLGSLNVHIEMGDLWDASYSVEIG